MFVYQNASEAEVSWRTPNATAYQRSDGGNASISFDNGPEILLDYYNSSNTGTDGPLLVYSTGTLSPEQHTVRIKNLFDVRGTLNLGYGQLNVDRFVIIPVPGGATSMSTSPSATTIPSSTAVLTSSTQSSTAKPGGSNNHAGAIAGGVVGGMVGLALISLALFLVFRRGRRPGYTAPPMTENTGYPDSDRTGAALQYRKYKAPLGGSGPWIGTPYEFSVTRLSPNDPRIYPRPPAPGPSLFQSSQMGPTPEL
ncbi:hypothetical protein BS47DRAFT_1363046 [Hydnum rufescens UP504]|uniref:Transmembrane protein n=1 Tax=Hydnum rufescens UP504 TaxID=1448309 RepID=A0A9P6AXK3_9AGAM|nr:hypothetical protein BS47DRAFT_1363046 [Hydnum rufescens UP504]